MAQSSYTVGTDLPLHKLRAHNEAVDSENMIHDDTVAAQYGFKGGLVPGVSVYAYMTYPIVQAFGADWLTRRRRPPRAGWVGQTATGKEKPW